MVCPTKQQTRIADWMKRHLPTDYSVQLTDVTSMFTVLLVIGPKSKELLSQLTDSDLTLGPSVFKVSLHEKKQRNKVSIIIALQVVI